MEEILSSIRRIIADEDKEDAADAKGAEAAGEEPGEAEARAGSDDDVLELTQVVREDGEVVELDGRKRAPGEAVNGSEAGPAEELELEPVEPGSESIQATPAAETSEVPVEKRDSRADNVVSEEAASASTQSFAKLAGEVTPNRAETQAAGQTVEQLVVEMMRPMLKEWLDKNLPGLVERVVQAEIGKLRKRAELD